ncbi:MAG: hypothetical protein AB1401_00550 [Thermodesulfobacteriota bacterium]
METPSWIQYTESVVGENHPSLADVANRPAKTIHTNHLSLLLGLRIKHSILKYVDDDEFKVSFPFTPPGESAWSDVTLKLALVAGGGQLKAGDAVTAHEFYVVYIANTVTEQPIAGDFVIREGQTTTESGYAKIGVIYNTQVTNAVIRAFDMAEHNVYMWRDGKDLRPLDTGAQTSWTDVDLDPAVGSTRYAPSTARQAIMFAVLVIRVTDYQYGIAWARKDGGAGNGRYVAFAQQNSNGDIARDANEFRIELVNGVFEYKLSGDAATLLTVDIYCHGFVDSDSVSVSD